MSATLLAPRSHTLTRSTPAQSAPARAVSVQPSVPTSSHPGAATAAADGVNLVRSLFGPSIATVEELVARDIEAFTNRRLARV